MPDVSLLQRAAELTEEELRDERERCRQEHHGRDGRTTRMSGFPYPRIAPLFFVKVGHPADLMPEARTQQFVYESFENMPQEVRNRVRIPEIYRTVCPTIGGCFIIMELLHGKTLRQLSDEYDSIEEFNAIGQPYFDQIARGLKLLLSIPVPPGAPPGPVGGGYIKHVIFKDFEAPIPFESVDLLEKYFNKVNRPERADLLVNPSKIGNWLLVNPAGRMSITFERKLHLVYSDLYEGNFVFTDDGLYIIDFEAAAFLPLRFMSYAIAYPSLMSLRVVARIEDQFDLPQESLVDMTYVSNMMGISSKKLGK